MALKAVTEAIFFPTPGHFRNWLVLNHTCETELIVGYYKKDSGLPSMTWDESVSEALCFGWIDGIRRSIDDKSYCIRFTPRKPTSIWSTVNINKMAVLTAEGKMTQAGLDAFAKRKEEKSAIYAYEKEDAELTDQFRQALHNNVAANQFFHALPASYRRSAIHWVLNAKQEATREKRMKELIADSEAGRRLKHLNYSTKK